MVARIRLLDRRAGTERTGLHPRRPGIRAFDVAIVGLGYVGLPLAREAASAGLRVLGYDVDSQLIDNLNSGRSQVDDVSDEDLRSMLARAFHPTSEVSDLGDADAIVVCVPTPLTGDNAPDLDAVISAAEVISGSLQPVMLVVLQPKTYPGTTDVVVCP